MCLAFYYVVINSDIYYDADLLRLALFLRMLRRQEDIFLVLGNRFDKLF